MKDTINVHLFIISKERKEKLALQMIGTNSDSHRKLKLDRRFFWLPEPCSMSSSLANGAESGPSRGYYCSQPNLAGDELLFVCEGDLWLGTLSEKSKVLAHRLTTSGDITSPVVSPDASAVAYISRQSGAQEVYLHDLQLTGKATRVTNWGQYDHVAIVGWTSAEATANLLVRRGEYLGAIFSSIVFECDPQRLSCQRREDLGLNVDFVHDNVIGRYSYDAHIGTWKRYGGGQRGQLWIKEADGKQRRILDQQCIANPVVYKGRIYFVLDDVTIRGNLCSVSLESPTQASLKQHTFHSGAKPFYVRNPTVCQQSGRIVYQYGGQLWLLNVLSSEAPVPLNIVMRGSNPSREAIVTDGTSDLETVRLDPDGRFLCATVRGRLVETALWEGPCSVHGDVEARLVFPMYLKGNNIGAFQYGKDPNNFLSFRIFKAQPALGGLQVNKSDAIVPSRNAGKTLSLGQVGLPVEAVASPTDTLVAFVTETNKLLLLDYGSTKVSNIISGHVEDAISDLTFSPCGSHLLFSFRYTSRASIIYAYNIGKDQLIKLTTEQGYLDHCPQVDPDCNYCFFLSSNRRLACVEDSLWNTSLDCYTPVSIMARALCPSAPDPTVLYPCAPKTGDSQGDDDYDEEEEDDSSEIDHSENNRCSSDKNADREDEEAEDEDAIMEITDPLIRIFEIPVDIGSSSSLLDIRSLHVLNDGRLLYVEGKGDSGAGNLVCFNMNTLKRTVLRTGDVDELQIPCNGEAMLVTTCDENEGELDFHCFSISNIEETIDELADPDDSGDGEGSKAQRPCKGYVDLEERVVLNIVPDSEWAPMLAEIFARREQAHALTASCPGIHIFQAYAELLPYVRSRLDFADLAAEMISEFSMSHIATWGGDFSVLGRYEVESSQGFLGVEGKLLSNGFEIKKVYQGVTWAADLRGPLALQASIGDRILAINGVQVGLTYDMSLEKALTGCAKREVIVELSRRAVYPNVSDPKSGETESSKQTRKTNQKNQGLGENEKSQLKQQRDDRNSKGRRKNNEKQKPQQHQQAQRREPARQLTQGHRQSTKSRPKYVKTLCRAKCVSFRGLSHLQYRDGVEQSRELVHAATKDAVGYINIPDMETTGYVRFAQDFLAEGNRQIMLIDVRGNPGGYSSEAILEKLGKSCMGVFKPKFGDSFTFPLDLGSTLRYYILLINYETASDAEIFANTFRKMGLGKIVGTRTWGGVTGYSRTSYLVDGSELTMPTLRFYGGQTIENCGVAPDINLDQVSAVEDEQLRKGIELALEFLQRNAGKLSEADSLLKNGL